jgi:hypothetical protein
MKLARNKRSAALLEADSIRNALEALAEPRGPRQEQLDFGPFGAIHGPDWQYQAWLEALRAEGRDLSGLRWYARVVDGQVRQYVTLGSSHGEEARS